MFVYWLMFTLAATSAVIHKRSMPLNSGGVPATKQRMIGFFLLLTLLIGFRHDVGGDFGNYVGNLELLQGVSFFRAISTSEPLYESLNWFGANIGGGIYFVDLICAALFSWGLIVFCRAQPRPYLALTVAMPYLVIVVAMGYTRQAVAIGLGMAGMIALVRGNFARFIGLVAVGALFHKSAVLLLPIAMFPQEGRRVTKFIGIGALGMIYIAVISLETVDVIRANYFDTRYASSGASVRVAMNVLPAAVLLVLKRHFQLDFRERKFWIPMAWTAFALIPALLISPSSTAVDRIGLYFIPLQLFVWSRFPDAIGIKGITKLLLMLGVIFYSAAVLFVWLIYGAFSFAWLPYQFYPWLLLSL